MVVEEIFISKAIFLIAPIASLKLLIFFFFVSYVKEKKNNG